MAFHPSTNVLDPPLWRDTRGRVRVGFTFTVNVHSTTFYDTTGTPTSRKHKHVGTYVRAESHVYLFTPLPARPTTLCHVLLRFLAVRCVSQWPCLDLVLPHTHTRICWVSDRVLSNRSYTIWRPGDHNNYANDHGTNYAKLIYPPLSRASHELYFPETSLYTRGRRISGTPNKLMIMRTPSLLIFSCNFILRM